MPTFSRIAIYTRNIPKLSAFYQEHFGFKILVDEDDYVELDQPDGPTGIVLLQASKGHRIGQSCIKLIFDVEDVPGFKAAAAKKGLSFGAVHQGLGYCFSNARDPSKNLVQISDRRFRLP